MVWFSSGKIKSQNRSKTKTHGYFINILLTYTNYHHPVRKYCRNYANDLRTSILHVSYVVLSHRVIVVIVVTCMYFCGRQEDLTNTAMATQSSDNLTRFALSGLSNMCGGAGEISLFCDCHDFEINIESMSELLFIGMKAIVIFGKL